MFVTIVVIAGVVVTCCVHGGCDVDDIEIPCRGVYVGVVVVIVVLVMCVCVCVCALFFCQ